jgi:hypothetical protein
MTVFSTTRIEYNESVVHCSIDKIYFREVNDDIGSHKGERLYH